jgi:3-hydroxyethyl bacteriochlorophyllide a dehydrogenase
METQAVVMNAPGELSLSRVSLTPVGETDVVVDVEWSGISTGTERLLWTGRMPAFPGMGYPLVPGYESIGRVVDAGPEARDWIGERVFVPGARCYTDVRGLFGGAASCLITGSERVARLDHDLGEEGVLFALAATARHAIAASDATPPDLIIGHGVLGRLLARLTIASGHTPPTVWETNASRRAGADGYHVVNPADDDRRNYRAIYDASGDASIIDELIGRLAPGGQVVLAGFYEQRISFEFSRAFMREARLRIAAEWKPDDLTAVQRLIASHALTFRGLITHRHDATDASQAYPIAFEDPGCLKMALDWRNCK